MLTSGPHKRRSDNCQTVPLLQGDARLSPKQMYMRVLLAATAEFQYYSGYNVYYQSQ
jgi:hypothetical protein